MMSPANDHHDADPLIEEVRQIRRAIWDQCGRDMRQHASELRKIEAAHRDRIVEPRARHDDEKSSRPARRRSA
jgi:hypothetical protein